MRTLLLGSIIALATLDASAQTGAPGKVTIQFESDRPEVQVTYPDGEMRTVELTAMDGQQDDDRLGSALAMVKAYESAGWTLVSSESCKGVSSSHYTWVVGKGKP
jgi:hypothetical protein